MTLKRAITIVAVTSLVFAIGGATVGWLLGTLAPDYYRVAFAAAITPDANPQQVGFGLGLAQGLVLGPIIGALIVVALAIVSRCRRPEREPITDP